MKKTFTASDKARIALEALKGVETTAQIASSHSMHPVQVGMWKKKLSEEAHSIFDSEHSEGKKIRELNDTIDKLYQLVGQRDAELVWLKKKLGP
ncbi:MAG: transposase [Candidatus Harrisonbacteria bacterium]|nr:transposase [Candidatus Harrisonbacteria bacterium]